MMLRRKPFSRRSLIFVFKSSGLYSSGFEYVSGLGLQFFAAAKSRLLQLDDLAQEVLHPFVLIGLSKVYLPTCE